MPDERPPITDDEAEARAIMRETIERTGWYPTMRREERELLIQRDVDQHWHLMIRAARERLEQRIRQSRGG